MLSKLIKIGIVIIIITLAVLILLAYMGPRLSSHQPDGPCNTIGCPSRIKVIIIGEIPTRYELKMSSGFSRVTFECENNKMVHGSYQRQNAGSGVYLLGYDEDVTGCIDGGVVVNQFVPRKFSITIQWDEGEKTIKYRPKYEWCNGSCCMCGTFEFTLP